jgi:hypothetical protein
MSEPRLYDLAPRWHDHKEPAVMMAYHLRFEHGMALRKIAKRVGLPYQQVREMFVENKETRNA